MNAISFIYAYPITGYMLYKNKPILVYSKEDGFRDVATYGKNSIDYLKKHIYNDMIHYRIYDSIDKKYYLTNSLKNIGDHPPIWKIKNNSLLKKRWAIDLEKEKLVKFNDNGDGIYYTTKTIISIDSIK